MAYRWKNTLSDCDATPEAVFLNRRQLMAGAAALPMPIAQVSPIGEPR